MKRKLNEDFKSARLQKLTSFFPKGVDWKSVTTRFKIEIDQITDDQVQVVHGPDAKKMMTKNPELLGFFIWTGEHSTGPTGLMGIKLGGKFVRMSTDTSADWDYNDKDSRINRKKVNKNGYFSDDTGIRNTTGSANSYYLNSSNYNKNSTGAFTAGDFWSSDVIVYLIDTNNSSNAVANKLDTRKKNADIFQAMKTIKTANLYRYKNSLKKLRETRNPDFIIEMKTLLDGLVKTVNDVTQLILSNPSKYRFSNVDITKHFGSGRNSISDTKSMLRMMVDAFYSFDKMVENYKSGDTNYSTRELVHKSYEYREITNIISKIESHAKNLLKKE